MVDNQHKLIKGYRDLTPQEIEMMNRIKEKATELNDLITETMTIVAMIDLQKHNDGVVVMHTVNNSPVRWINLARDHLQIGIMALIRAVAKPETF